MKSKKGFILSGFLAAVFMVGIMSAFLPVKSISLTGSLATALFQQSDIPNNMDEAMIALERVLPNETINEIKNMSEEDFVAQAHFGLGMWIRNNWKLWTGTSPMDWYFYKRGIFHPDDMSGIILTSFHRHLNNKPINIKEQAKFYRDYWKNNQITLYKGN
jgi:hypothetical protein